MLIFCPNCKKTVTDEMDRCSRCGALTGTGVLHHIAKTLQTSKGEAEQAVDCPVCGAGDMVKMNARSRGRALLHGHLRTCLTASHRCSSCGHAD